MMKNNRLATILLLSMVLLVVVGAEFWGMFATTAQARAQAQEQPQFLHRPYYGEFDVYSFFDHEYPTYGGEPNNYDEVFTRFDGKRWTETPRSECELGVNCYDGHNGLDFPLSYERVLAADEGEVVWAGWELDSNNNELHWGGYGLYVEILHNVGKKSFITRYGHLTAIAVYVGQNVNTGQIIGVSGSTGESTGPHLHFDVRIVIDASEIAIDPFGWTGEGEDPWSVHEDGTESWCLWVDGEFEDCDPFSPGRAIPTPAAISTLIVEDYHGNDDVTSFTKGYGGRWNNPCLGVDTGAPTPGVNYCRSWWEEYVGSGGRIYRTIADGETTQDNWAKWQPDLPTSHSGLYEVFVYIPAISDDYLPVDTFTWKARFVVVNNEGKEYDTLVGSYAS